MNTRDFIALNSQCENALIDKPFHDHSTTWVEDHKSLFEQVKIFINQNDDGLVEYIYSFYNIYLACVKA